MPKSEFIEAGRLNNTHGIAGELHMEVWLDTPDFMKRFKRIFVEGKEYQVDACRPQKNGVILKLHDINDINAAMPFKGRTAFIARADANLAEDDYFLQDLIGIRVVDEAGAEVGILKDIVEYPSSVIYVVQGKTEHLIPAVPEFIRKADLDAGVLTVHMIEGL